MKEQTSNETVTANDGNTLLKEELIKELELLADSCDSNYALEMNGYNRGVLDALSLVNKYFALADVSGRREQLIDFANYVQGRMWEGEDKDLSEFVEEFLSL